VLLLSSVISEKYWNFEKFLCNETLGWNIFLQNITCKMTSTLIGKHGAFKVVSKARVHIKKRQELCGAVMLLTSHVTKGVAGAPPISRPTLALVRASAVLEKSTARTSHVRIFSPCVYRIVVRASQLAGQLGPRAATSFCNWGSSSIPRDCQREQKFKVKVLNLLKGA